MQVESTLQAEGQVKKYKISSVTRIEIPSYKSNRALNSRCGLIQHNSRSGVEVVDVFIGSKDSSSLECNGVIERHL